MKALITGGAGFIGSHIAERMVQRDDQVVIVDNLSSGNIDNLNGFIDKLTFVRGDVRDAEELAKLATGCDVIFHQAAIVSVPYSVEHPQETHDVNIQGTLNVLFAARTAGVRRVVFASSAAVYGEDAELPKVETMRPAPCSPYGIEKMTGEYYCRVFSELYGVETVSLRYFNVFGPRQDPASPYSGVVSIFVDRSLRDEQPTIFGDGQQTRDFVFVDNVVAANLLAATRPGVGGQCFNVAYGHETTLLDVLHAIGDAVGTTPEPIFADPRVGDIRHSLADIGAARSGLGYDPKVDVQAGLAHLVAFQKERI